MNASYCVMNVFIESDRHGIYRKCYRIFIEYNADDYR